MGVFQPIYWFLLVSLFFSRKNIEKTPKRKRNRKRRRINSDYKLCLKKSARQIPFIEANHTEDNITPLAEVDSIGLPTEGQEQSFEKKVRNTDTINTDLKSTERDANVNSSGDTKAQRFDLWEVLFSSKHFRIKPQTLEVYHFTRDAGTTGQDDRLRKEEYRLRTFANYPTSAPKSALVLAHCGFVYTGEGDVGDDLVTCVFCNAVKKSWRPEDDVEEVHRRLSPACPLMSGNHAENVPMTSPALAFQELLDNFRTQDDREFQATTASRETNPDSTQTHTENPRLSASCRPTVQSLVYTTSRLTNLSVESSIVASSTSTTEALLQDRLLVSNETTSAEQRMNDVNTLQNQILDLTGGPQPGGPQPGGPQPGGPQQGGSSYAPTGNDVNSNSSNSHRDQRSTANERSSNQISSSNAAGPTYSELGIVTDRPKRPEYALKSERLKTFSMWPNGHHLQPTELADAGFYFAGYGDCARCFYCGGGLRNWEDEDDAWVEHARWFSKCSYIRQRLGQVFVDAVLDLNKTLDKIPFNEVVNRIGAEALTVCQIDVKEDTLTKDPAVKSIVQFGIPLNVAIDAAKVLKSEDTALSADKLLARIKEERRDVQIPSYATHQDANSSCDLESIRKLKKTNNELRQQTACKICMDSEVEIVFLPCGHLVSCTECASAMRDCPVCRKHVKGTVRAFIS